MNPYSRKLIVALALVAQHWLVSSAAAEPWALKTKDYFNPLSSEPRAARLAIEPLGRSDSFPFSKTDQKTHRVWEITMGQDFPLFGWQKLGRQNGAAQHLAGDWGIGIWMPVSFHMIEYMDGDSNPIVNNDYRFAGSVKFAWTFVKGWDVAGKVQVGHESTHLGDEFTIFAERAHPDTFERVNVSWEYVEFAAGVEGDKLSVRGGDIRVLGDDGFYSDHLLESVVPERQIPISHRNHEPWIGAEYRTRRPAWRGSSYEWFASADLRFRTVYDLHRASSTDPEDVEPSLNLLVGVRAPVVQGTENLLREIYFRWYNGVNPHGQFRTQRDYTYLAVGLRFGFDF